MTTRAIGLTLAFASLVCFWASSVAAKPRPAHNENGRELVVFAAASLADAFQELGRRLEQEHGIVVRFNFAGSHQLAAQLEHGPRADVFASADELWMTHVETRGLLAEKPQSFAHQRLIVIVPATNPARIKDLRDLARPGVKLVIGAPAVPVGRYTRELLGNLARTSGFASDYPRRVLANVVSEEENVKSVVAKVQLGEADAGVVYRGDVGPQVRRYVRTFAIPDSANVIATYPIAVLAGSRDPEGARAFVALVLSPEGQRTLARHGLIPTATVE